MKPTSVLLVPALLGACSAMEPRTIELAVNPQVAYSRVNIGRGVAVKVNLIDHRNTKMLGRGTWRPPTGSWGLFPDEVYVPRQDIKTVLERIIKEGLLKMQFDVSVSRAVPTRLSVELQHVDIAGVTGAAHVGLRAVVYKNEVRTFERNYISHAPGIPRAFSKVEEPLNVALADVSQHLLADLEMLEALAKCKGVRKLQQTKSFLHLLPREEIRLELRTRAEDCCRLSGAQRTRPARTRLRLINKEGPSCPNLGIFEHRQATSSFVFAQQ